MSSIIQKVSEYVTHFYIIHERDEWADTIWQHRPRLCRHHAAKWLLMWFPSIHPYTALIRLASGHSKVKETLGIDAVVFVTGQVCFLFQNQRCQTTEVSSQVRRWVFGASGGRGGVNFGMGSEQRNSASCVQGAESGDEPTEAEETLQIVHIEKVGLLCAWQVVPKRRWLDYPRWEGRQKGVTFSPQICANLTGASDHGWVVRTPKPPGLPRTCQ